MKTPPKQNWLQEKFDLLAPDDSPPPRLARARLQDQITTKEQNMWQKIFRPQYRAAWTAALIIGILAFSLRFPQVQAVANSFLGLFRVERIEAVSIGIDLEDLPAELENQFMALDRVIGDQLIVEDVGEPVEVANIAAASDLVNFAVRAPAKITPSDSIMVQAATEVSLVIDRQQWQILIDELGYTDFVLPASADGATVAFNVPDTVVMGFGDCVYNAAQEIKIDAQLNQNCTVFYQSGLPSIEAPPGIDINRAGQIMLEMLGLSATEAAQFSSQINWATTLVIPVPRDADYKNVQVDGVDGVFLEDLYSNQGEIYTLLWVRDEMLYALTGNGTLTDALAFVRSLE